MGQPALADRKSRFVASLGMTRGGLVEQATKDNVWTATVTDPGRTRCRGGERQTWTSTAERRSLPVVTADSRALTTTASNFAPVRDWMRWRAKSRSIAF